MLKSFIIYNTVVCNLGKFYRVVNAVKFVLYIILYIIMFPKGELL